MDLGGGLGKVLLEPYSSVISWKACGVRELIPS